MSKSIARERWGLLRSLLFSSAEEQAELLSRPSAISKRSHGQYQLFDVTPYKLSREENRSLSSNIAHYSWYQYSSNGKKLFVIRQTTPKLTIHDFFTEYSGFLNTGNICIWPAEEILAWYILENPDLFKGKSICELGAGMAGLAGVVAASLCAPSKLILTEGNPQCVENLAEIIKENLPPNNTFFPSPQGNQQGEKKGEEKGEGKGEKGEGKRFESRQILWEKEGKYEREFEILLIADCLYSLDVHESLLNVIKQTLLPNGLVYIMAPKRGPSFEAWKKHVEEDGTFAVEVQTKYSEAVWKKHQDFLQNDSHYKEDVHYPLLMVLSWKKPDLEEPERKRRKLADS